MGMAASEDFVDTTIANLKVIGMVAQNGRLCVRKGQLCLEGPDGPVPQGLRRWMRGDSRDVTLMHVRNSICNANRVVQLSGGNVWTLRRIARELAQCEVGLQNLLITYASDSIMVANLGVVIERVVAYKGHLLSEHPDLQPFSTPPIPVSVAHTDDTDAEADAVLRSQSARRPPDAPAAEPTVTAPAEPTVTAPAELTVTAPAEPPVTAPAEPPVTAPAELTVTAPAEPPTEKTHITIYSSFLEPFRTHTGYHQPTMIPTVNRPGASGPPDGIESLET